MSNWNAKSPGDLSVEIDELMRIVAAALEAEGVPYLVTGSIASIFYGEPRLTMDVDILVDLPAGKVKALRAHFPESDYYFSEEAAQEAIRHGRMFNIIHPASGLKADLIVARPDPENLARLKRVREISAGSGVRIRFSTPEDLILSKLKFYQEGGSEKHLRDIQGILRANPGGLDLDLVSSTADQQGLGAVWRKLLESSLGAQ